MNAYAIFAVNEHLEYLIDEAARNRAAAGKPRLRARIASTISGLRQSVATTTYETSSILPKLEDYPYRG